MPTLVARRTQVRLGPTVSLVSEEMKWSPVVVFGPIGAAYFAFVPWPPRLNFARLNACRQDNLL